MRSKDKKGSALKWLLGLLVVVAIALGALFLYIKDSIGQILISNENSTPIEELKVEDDYALNFLIMGVDNDVNREKKGLSGKRTDSLMILSLNTQSEAITMYSIPRDTITVIYDENDNEVTEYGKYFSKINSAYESGEEQAVINSVERLFPDIDIDYYGTFNFISFKQIVDAIDGIELDVPTDIYDYKLEKILVEAGSQTLNGEQALDFARARYQDDDIQRGYRQQMVIKAIADKLMTNINVSQLVPILNAVKGNVVTDLSLSDIKSLYTATNGKNFTFNKVEAGWTPFDLNGESSVFLPSGSREKVTKEINESIGRSYDGDKVTGESAASLQTGLNEFEHYLYEYGMVDVNSEYMDSFLDPVNYPPVN